MTLILTLVVLCSGCLVQTTRGGQPSALKLSAHEIEERLSAPVFNQVAYEEASVDGANGTKLWLNTYRPSDAQDPVPVILVMTPYRALSDAKSTACTDIPRQQCPYLPDLVDFYVPRGYAVAFADVRGNHNSGGCSDFASLDIGQDGYNVVEWLAARPWSNGRVGMYGGSYDADAQIATASLNPPHLVTIVPTAATTSSYDYFFYEGVPYLLQGPL
ncbi:MAG TPA: CocE/NonD family hydrolase, partial [Gemmatimonadaceae bacterium]